MTALLNPAAWAPVILAWSFLLLLPFGRSSELLMFILATRLAMTGKNE